MSTYPVTVSNIATSTTQQHLHDFFSFCGKITSIDHNESSGTAVVHFEKPSAANTALMLNGGTLDGAHLTVHSETEHHEHHDATHTAEGIEQSDKPRAGIAAEYLAKGYMLSDTILQRAIEIDSKKGISSRFLSYIKSFDQSVGAKVAGPDQTLSGKVQATVAPVMTDMSAKVKAVDEQRGISKTAQDYYSSAFNSPFGQKVFQFYSSTTKQVMDIHEEALRIADAQKTTTMPATAPATGSTAAAPPVPMV
jgi:RNA recognition motif-containing protein